MKDLGDENYVRETSKRVKLDDRQKGVEFSKFMSTPAGRAWVYDFLASLHVFHSTFSVDPNATAFKEGQRAAGLALLAEVSKACPKFYIEMLSERLEQDNEKRAREDG